MPDYLKRTGRDTTDDILVRVPESEKKVARLGGPASKRLGIDRGSIPSVADPLEGQMMIQYSDEAVGSTPVSPDVGATFNGEQPYYFSNQEWRPFVAGSSVVPQEEWFQVVSVSIGGISSDTLTWSRLAGPLLLDLTTPTQPVVLANGVYSLDVTAEVTSNSLAHNQFQLIANAIQGAYTGAAFAQNTFSLDSTAAISASLSTTNKMFAADSFQLQIFNHDTAARDFSCPTVRVTKILDFA